MNGPNLGPTGGGGSGGAGLNLQSVDDLTDQLASKLVSSTSMKLRQFGGSRTEKESTCRWIEDFEDMAASMNWDAATKARKLPVYLTGPAKDWYRLDIAPTPLVRGNYDEVKRRLVVKFSPTSPADHQRHQMQTR